MAFFSRSHLFGLLLLASLPLDCAAALATAAASQPSALSVEQRLQRIAAAAREQTPEGVSSQAQSDPRLAFTFVNAPAAGFGNGGFRNGGFYNGGFRNGGFVNGGFRNGGFGNGGFRNGGGFRNAGFRNFR